MKKKERFSGLSVRDFLNIHRGMPVQATIVKEYALLKKYDYDAFRYACDDYMRGVWRSSYYRVPPCKDNPQPGCFRHVQGIMGDLAKPRKPRKKRPTSVRRAVSSYITKEHIEFLLAYQSERCPCCEAILTKCGYHIDHIMPVKLGGDDVTWNIQLLCHGCNTRKSAMNPHEWAAMHGIELPKYFILKVHPFN